jgi:hypothetical protein
MAAKEFETRFVWDHGGGQVHLCIFRSVKLHLIEFFNLLEAVVQQDNSSNLAFYELVQRAVSVFIIPSCKQGVNVENIFSLSVIK